MPSRLTSTNPTFRQRDAARAQALSSVIQLAARGPWMGYTPDLSSHFVDLNYANSCNALFPRALTSQGSQGEVLMPEPGWERVDAADPAASLPGTTTINHANPEVVWIGQFAPTGKGAGSNNYDILAWTAGDGATENTAALWGINSSDSLWDQIAHTNTSAGNPLANAVRPQGDRDQMPDAAVFVAGASARSDFSGAIAEPVLILTNDLDPVYVFPDGTGSGTFEDLTDQLDPFLARSVEVFNNRVYFLNTSETGTRYPQRLRRTPPFTCDPDPAQVGAGAIDLADYHGDGLRAERLGNVLACYFEDGVAFIRPTGNYMAPDVVQTISTSRGLISTHSLVNIGNDLHFGIFTDGWFELDQSGRFREVNHVDTGGGVLAHRWKDTFYNLLAKDPAKRGRLYCQYEADTNKIYISIPTDEEGENSRVWVYERESDRVFPDNYEALCFGEFDRLLRTAETYDSISPKTYTSIVPETYASVGALYGVRALAHGDSTGFIFQHDPDLITRDDAADTGNSDPVWHYETPLFAGEDPNGLMTVDRVLVEYVNLGEPNMSVKVSNGNGTDETRTIITNNGEAGDIHTGHSGFRTNGRQLSYRLSGNGAVMIRSFQTTILSEKVEYYGDQSGGGG